MKKIHLLSILVMLLVASSCITSRVGFSREQLMAVHKGMTLKQVTEVLGSPTYRNFDDKGEIWEFRVLVLEGYSVASVRFIDGKVSEMKTYLERDCPAKVKTAVEIMTSSDSAL